MSLRPLPECPINDKENALKTIRFDHPAYVMTGPPIHWIGYLGVNLESYDGITEDAPVGTTWTDVWGTVWHRELDGVMGFPRSHPMADLVSALKTTPWPNPEDERIIGRIYTEAEKWEKSDTFLCGSHRETLWEKAYMLVGMENLMVYLKTEPNAVKELLHRIIDFDLAIARHYLAVGIEIAGCGDDLGTQQGLLFSPRMLNEFFIPEYRRLLSLYQQHHVWIEFHSCGHITPLLPTFMELGVDILNPIQASANDLDEVRRVTQGKMALCGGISSGLIVSGPIAAIQREAAKRIWQLGQQGGYFCAPDQGMPWPAEHLAALEDAVRKYGKYPLVNHCAE